MFRNLPNTEEVRKAKSELLSMMEDKFEELIAEGKTENEAVGVVISEFGNLDEVAESIGLSNEVKETASFAKPMLSMDRIKDYLSVVSSRSLLIPLGIALCIMSVTCNILADILGDGAILDTLGVIGFFIMVAAAVVLFVISGSKNKEFNEINNDEESLGIESCDYVRNERRRFKPTYSTMAAIGIALCIISVTFPIIVSAIPVINDDFGAILFLFSVAVGVFLIVSANVRMNGYEKLLKLNGAGKMSEEFIPKEDRKISKAPIIIGVIVVVLVLGIAMIMGFVRIFSFVSTGDKYYGEYDLDIDSVDEIDKINVDAEACSIVIRTSSDVDSVEASYSGDESLMPEVTFEDGVITVSQHISGSAYRFRNGAEVVLVFAEDVDLDEIEINADAGNLEISDINVDNLSGEFDAGNIELQKCVCAIVSLTADAGNVEVNGCEFGSITLDTNAGNIDINDTTFEIVNITNDFGDVEINDVDNIDYYTIDASCDLGSVEVGGRDYGTTCITTGTGSGSITVSCDAGDIEIGN